MYLLVIKHLFVIYLDLNATPMDTDKSSHGHIHPEKCYAVLLANNYLESEVKESEIITLKLQMGQIKPRCIDEI